MIIGEQYWEYFCSQDKIVHPIAMRVSPESHHHERSRAYSGKSRPLRGQPTYIGKAQVRATSSGVI